MEGWQAFAAAASKGRSDGSWIRMGREVQIADVNDAREITRATAAAVEEAAGNLVASADNSPPQQFLVMLRGICGFNWEAEVRACWRLEFVFLLHSNSCQCNLNPVAGTGPPGCVSTHSYVARLVILILPQPKFALSIQLDSRMHWEASKITT